MAKITSFIFSYLLALTLVGASSMAVAQEQNEVSSQEALAEKSAQIEAQIKPIDEETTKLQSQAEAIKKRLDELKSAKDTALKDLAVPASAAELRDVMIHHDHGGCKITETENPGEFIIVKTDKNGVSTKIRFLFAPSDSANKPVVKKIVASGVDQLEYFQPEWSNVEPKDEAHFGGTVRGIIKDGEKTMTITQSYFRGERIDERFLGGFLQPKLSPVTDVVCVDVVAIGVSD